MIVPRRIPAYDERFIGSGWNKVSHIIELDAVGSDSTHSSSPQFISLGGIYGPNKLDGIILHLRKKVIVEVMNFL